MGVFVFQMLDEVVWGEFYLVCNLGVGVQEGEDKLLVSIAELDKLARMKPQSHSEKIIRK